MPKRRSPDSTENLKLDFRHPFTKPATHRVLRFRGLSLEYTRVTSAAEYEFNWTGKHHYLALHDLVMDSGELNVAGMPGVPGGDIRDKMTYIPAGRPLSGWSKAARRQNSFTILHFDPTLLSEETGRLFSETRPVIYFEDSAVLSTMKKLESVIAEGLDHPDIFTETLALLAALEVGNLENRWLLANDRVGRLSVSQETLLRDFMETHIASNISLNDLGELVQLSRFHLARRFKATFGVPPFKYLTDRRIEIAKRLLTETTLSVEEIARSTGFIASSHLIRAFKLTVGTTPLVYRRG